MISFRRHVSGLDSGLVLAPERYDPRRNLATPGVPLSELVTSVRGMIDPSKTDPDGRYLVLDTGDADRGFLLPHNNIVNGADVGSAKKRVISGSVLISRLRPYLRQIAYAHPYLFEGEGSVLCSSEFFVLQSRDDRSIAYLVPWLLSSEVQLALSAGQEGGHHPRVREEMLLGLQVPQRLLDARDGISDEVSRAVGGVLSSRYSLENQVVQVGELT